MTRSPAFKEAVTNLQKLTSPDSSLDKALKNAEKVHRRIVQATKISGSTLHNLKETSAQLNTTVAELECPVQKNRAKPNRSERHGETTTLAIDLAFHQKI